MNETIVESKFSLSGEDYNEYLHLKNLEKEREAKAQADWNNLELEFPSYLFANIPSTKIMEVKNSAKLEIMQLEMKKAQELIVKLNSPFKNRELARLHVDFRNMHRQLVWNRVRLKMITEGKEVLDKDGKPLFSFELEFLVDKLGAELNLMREELTLYGLDETQLIS